MAWSKEALVYNTIIQFPINFYHTDNIFKHMKGALRFYIVKVNFNSF